MAHYSTLAEVYGLNWKKMPAYTTLRDIIQGTSSAELEAGFRAYSAELAVSESPNRFEPVRELRWQGGAGQF